MKIIRPLKLLFCLLLLGNPVFSQQNKDAISSSSPFLFPEFTDGVVTMKDGNLVSVKLNYDASIDQMQFLGKKEEILNIKEPEKVMEVEIGTRNFIYIKYYFLEQLTVGPVSLYLRVHQRRNVEKVGAFGGTGSTSSIETLSSVRLINGDIVKLTPNEKVSYQAEFNYYVINNRKTKLVTNQYDLLKCFPAAKKMLKQELSRQHTNFSSVESMKKIIDWVNANGLNL